MSRFLPRVLAERYKLLRSLGGSGLGTVHEAELIRTGMPVAVKLLHPLLGKSGKARDLLDHDVRLVSAIDHDALVPVMDRDEDIDGAPFLVSELLKGQSLRDKLAMEKVVSIRDALWIGWHVADALAATHNGGALHLGLKPGNIFLQRQRHVSARVRILDFGMARAREQLSGQTLTITKDGKSLGTALYLSPEQVGGDREIDRRSDVYALAVLLYEAMTGQAPYPGADSASPMELLRMIMTSEPIPLRYLRPDAPRSLEEALAKALTKSRADRTGSMEELKVAMAKIAAEPPPGAPVTDLEWGDDRFRTGQSTGAANSTRTPRSKRTKKP